MSRIGQFLPRSPFPPEGRLTLTTAVPVTTSDVTGATTVYYTPYKGGWIWLYTNSVWQPYLFTERSLALGTLSSDKNYDIFIYDNAGTVTLEFSAAWSTDTGRADALAYQNGFLVKSGSTNKLWLGTIRTTATTTTEDSVAKRFLCNAYNDEPREMFICPAYVDDNAQTGYNKQTAVYADLNGGTNDKIQYLNMNGRGVVGELNFVVSATACWSGIGDDSTTTPARASISLVNSGVNHSCKIAKVDGYHFFAGLIYTGNLVSTVIADFARTGAAADPPATYLSGTVFG